MGRARDVDAFEARATGYDEGWLGAWHRQVVEATAAAAVQAMPDAGSVLDLGCGTGALVRRLAQRPDSTPSATGRLIGLDASPKMVEVARQSVPPGEKRLLYVVGRAEKVPLPDRSVDLVVSTTSFDHWADQAAGLRECRRVLRPAGRLVLADLISPVLWPTTLAGRRGHARTPGQVERLLTAAGLRPLTWHRIATLIQAVTATPTPS